MEADIKRAFPCGNGGNQRPRHQLGSPLPSGDVCLPGHVACQRVIARRLDHDEPEQLPHSAKSRLIRVLLSRPASLEVLQGATASQARTESAADEEGLVMVKVLRLRVSSRSLIFPVGHSRCRPRSPRSTWYTSSAYSPPPPRTPSVRNFIGDSLLFWCQGQQYWMTGGILRAHFKVNSKWQPVPPSSLSY